MGDNCHICAKPVGAGEVLCFECRERLFVKNAGKFKKKTVVPNAFSRPEIGEKALESVFEDSMGYSDKQQLIRNLWTGMRYRGWECIEDLEDADIFAFREGRYVLVQVRVVKHFRDISCAFNQIMRYSTRIADGLPCSFYVVIEPHPDLTIDKWKDMKRAEPILPKESIKLLRSFAKKFTSPIKVLPAKKFCEKVEKDAL